MLLDILLHLKKLRRNYLYTGHKPIEVIHFLELFYEIKGFRILDKNNVIMFEWMSDNVSKGTWKVISGSSSQDK